MIDLASYIVFMFVGISLGSFFGWLVMRRLWSGKPVNKDFIGMLLAALTAMFSATR